MLLITEKQIKRGICHTIHRYARANNKYMKIIIKKIHHIWCIYMQIIYMAGKCLKIYL